MKSYVFEQKVWGDVTSSSYCYLQSLSNIALILSISGKETYHVAIC